MPTNEILGWKISSQGDRTLMLNLQPDLSVENGKKCANLALAIRNANIRGVVDVVSSFNAVAVHYQPKIFGSSTTFKNLTSEVSKVVELISNQDDSSAIKTIEIPVCYGGEYGPDLLEVAQLCNLDPQEVINIHSQDTLCALMLGFAPGAPYVGMHDPRLHVGRRKTPRTSVRKGSVAIANCQSIVYPNVSPGGWNLIGTTPIDLFFPEKENPTLINPGDNIKFVPISEEEFLNYQG